MFWHFPKPCCSFQGGVITEKPDNFDEHLTTSLRYSSDVYEQARLMTYIKKKKKNVTASARLDRILPRNEMPSFLLFFLFFFPHRTSTKNAWLIFSISFNLEGKFHTPTHSPTHRRTYWESNTLHCRHFSRLILNSVQYGSSL